MISFGRDFYLIKLENKTLLKLKTKYKTSQGNSLKLKGFLMNGKVLSDPL